MNHITKQKKNESEKQNAKTHEPKKAICVQLCSLPSCPCMWAVFFFFADEPGGTNKRFPCVSFWFWNSFSGSMNYLLGWRVLCHPVGVRHHQYCVNSRDKWYNSRHVSATSHTRGIVLPFWRGLMLAAVRLQKTPKASMHSSLVAQGSGLYCEM